MIEDRGGPGNRIVASRAVGGGKGSAGSGVRRIIRLLPGGKVASGIAAIRGLNGEGVIVIDVAGRASWNLTRGDQLVRIGERETGGAVIESGTGPVDGVVARGAVANRESGAGSGVRGIVGTLPSRQVAAGIAAIGGLNGEGKIAVDVARSATGNFAAVGDELVRVGKGETGGAVIEFAVGPSGDGVAGRASCGGGREIRGDVIGNIAAEGLRLVPVGLMAGEAIGGIQRIIVVDVAGSTGRRRGRHVRAGESETGNAMVKRSSVPTLCGVAVGAVCCREGGSGTGMNGGGGLLPFGEVATGVSAVRGSDLQTVIVIDVAGGAGNVGVAIGEQETSRRVVKNGGGPIHGVVARGAIGSSESRTCGGVRWVSGLLPLGEVAILACAGSQGVVVVDVASSAGDVGVAVGQRETSRVVVEDGGGPTHGSMASTAK